ncbi:hypothetical protein GOQ27_04465 [Clostridium sp. D2Q-11]|uniref:Uncharacterized protein n=1 Tax=Anaeromonas frigoriresistens TaxID=2683708 RepID=A0A942UY14_9FIRM|nr:hypothetical protein [Anaeromonas frigoriresistens]MBS4537702.1 hypothetical protein [Anaeromonas frigoriresistens]
MNRDNKRIIKLFVFIISLFVLIIVYLTYFNLFDAWKLKEHPNNFRNTIEQDIEI